MNKNIIIIIGKKVNTPPTPPIIPSTIKDESTESPNRPPIASPNKPKPSSIRSWKGAPIVKVSWNIIYIITKNIGIPKIMLVKYLSILSDTVGFSTAGLLTASFISPSINAYLALAITSSAPSL